MSKPRANKKKRLTGVAHAYRAASIFLSETSAFRLAVAIFGHPVRLAHWIEQLTTELTKAKVYLTECRIPETGEPRLIDELTAHLRDVATLPGHTRAVVVTGISRHLPDAATQYHPGDPTPRFLADANLDRELFPIRCPHPLLLCLTPTAHGRFLSHAPDLMHWCSHTFDFTEPALPDGSQPIRAMTELQQFEPGAIYANRDEMLRAAGIFRAGLDAAIAAHGLAHRETLEVRANLANVLHQLGRTPEALDLAQENLRGTGKLEEIPDAEIASRSSQLAHYLLSVGRLAEAEPLMRQSLASDVAALGHDHPSVATDMNNLAGLLQATNRLAEAEPLLRRALAISRVSLGDDHPKVATALNNLAVLLKDTNRLAEAEPLMRQALAIDEAALGKDHPTVALDLTNLAQLLKTTKRLAEAEPLMRQALTIHEAALGKHHPKVAIALNNLAFLLQDTNQLAEAEPLMRRALKIFAEFTRSAGHTHPHMQSAIGNYRKLLMEMGATEAQATEKIKNIIESAAHSVH